MRAAVGKPVGAAPASDEEHATLWVGDLQYWMEESYLHGCFMPTHGAQVVSVKVIRNKASGFPEGYGFIEFASRAVADSVLRAYNGTAMPNSQQTFA